MSTGRWIGGEYAFVSSEKASRLAANTARPFDIVVTQRGTLGQVALVPPGPYDKYVISQSQMKLTVNEQKADPQFVYYFFSSQAMQDYVKAHAIQTGVPHTNLGILRRTPLLLPSLPEQRAIAHILGTLDDKIELNRRMNQTLEAIARALFTSWFVDFEPVRAKAEGRQPEGMDAETAALFPDAFMSSSIGSIPAGWEVHPIGDAVRVVGGSTPSTSRPDYWNGNVAFCTPKDLSNLSSPVLLKTGRRVTASGLATISSSSLPAGTVLMSSRAPIGYLAISAIEVAINQGMVGMICDGHLPNHYVLLWARQNMDTIVGNANGTTFLEISKRNFRPIPALVPSQEILERFEQIAAPSFDRIEANERENVILTTVRDTLLPRMLSGELRVPVADALVEAVP